jgi:hypothetical protein
MTAEARLRRHGPNALLVQNAFLIAEALHGREAFKTVAAALKEE